MLGRLDLRDGKSTENSLRWPLMDEEASTFSFLLLEYLSMTIWVERWFFQPQRSLTFVGVIRMFLFWPNHDWNSNLRERQKLVGMMDSRTLLRFTSWYILEFVLILCTNRCCHFPRAQWFHPLRLLTHSILHYTIIFSCVSFYFRYWEFVWSKKWWIEARKSGVKSTLSQGCDLWDFGSEPPVFRQDPHPIRPP